MMVFMHLIALLDNVLFAIQFAKLVVVNQFALLAMMVFFWIRIHAM